MNDIKFANYADDNIPVFVGNDKIIWRHFPSSSMTIKWKPVRISAILFVALTQK